MIANILTGVVAALHFYFMYLEMFLWTTPKGLRIFGMTKSQAEASRTLALNQGLYNGFLGAGLVWGLTDDVHGYSVRVFFLVCVVLAGFLGAWTVNRKIFFVQALPAGLALAALFV